MKNKPLVFTVLTILCVLEPFIKVLYFKALTHFDFSVILSNLLIRNSLKDIFDFWLIFPVAGLLILRLRQWTYFGFMGILSYIIFTILTYESYSWPYYSATPFLYHYVVVGFASVVFMAFLLPQVREPFFERRVRLWENTERYPVRIQSLLNDEKKSVATEILNVSKSGAFIAGSFGAGNRLVLQFSYAGKSFELPVLIKHSHSFNGVKGHGVKFHSVSWTQHFHLRRMIYELKQKNHPATVMVKPL